jgi:hypothetical protein
LGRPCYERTNGKAFDSKERRENMRTWLFISIIAGMTLITGACSAPMFMVSIKGDERMGQFLGKKTDFMYELLCVSGGLQKVLETTQWNTEMKEEFYQSNCSTGRSYDKVRRIYKAMTREQRKDIRTAFKKNGYAINAGGVC